MKTKTTDSGFLLVTHGSAVAKIYIRDREKNGTKYTEHAVVYHDGAKRVRRYFSDLDEAKQEAERALIALVNGQTKALTLNNAEAESYTLAAEALKPTGINLLTAAREYRNAFDLLKGKATINDAVRYYIANAATESEIKTVPEVLAALIAARTKDGVSKFHLKDLRLRGGHFAKAFKRPIGDIGSDDLNTWLYKLSGSHRNRNNMAAVISNLFRFAQENKWLSQNRPIATEFMKRAKRIKAAPIEIFTPDEAARMLHRVNSKRPDLLPFLAIGLFSGIRVEETKRLDWSAVKLEEGHIELDAEDTKLSARRIVPIQPNLAKWLQPYKGKKGTIAPIGKAVEILQKVVEGDLKRADGTEDKGVAWKRNAMRHSYGSYRLRSINSADTVALEMGNSPRMIQNHYHKLVTEAQAKEFWAIAP
jgi:integrase